MGNTSRSNLETKNKAQKMTTGILSFSKTKSGFGAPNTHNTFQTRAV